MDLQKTRVDPDRIESGQWVGDIPDMDDLRLHVRGLNSKTVVLARSKRERKEPRENRERDGSLKADAALRVFRETLIEDVLLGWENVQFDGQTVPYSKEQAREWLHDPTFQKFADAVTWAAQVVDRAYDGILEEAAKN